MRALDALGAAEREADSVQAHGIVAPQSEQAIERRAIGHVVLRMDLEPADGGAGRRDLGHMRRAQADADLARDRPLDALLAFHAAHGSVPLVTHANLAASPCGGSSYDITNACGPVSTRPPTGLEGPAKR